MTTDASPEPGEERPGEPGIALPEPRCGSRTVAARGVDLGRFLCHQSAEPGVERADAPSPADLKQEAVLAVLLARAKRGGEPGPGCERIVNEDAGLARVAYARARVDFYRSRRGRQKRAVELQSLDAGEAEPSESETEELREPVDSQAVLRRIVRERVPGLSQRQLQRVVVVMSEAQAIKRRKGAAMPDALRAALARLRKSTGLPLDTSLL